MSANQATPNGAHEGYNVRMLFFVSCLSLTTAGISFAVRATITEDVSKLFAIDSQTVGGAIGAAFLAFAIAVFFGSPLCDYVGMKALLGVAALLHVGGSVLAIMTPQLAGTISPVHNLWLGMFLVGLAHGLVEAVINPLIVTLYPDDKTHRMNVLHAWWPGGLIIGGLLAVGLRGLDVNWQGRLAMVILPAIVYGIIVLTMKFPPTERVAAGVSSSAMWKEALKPLFVVLFLCMFLTASLELGPGQWVDGTLSRTVGFQGIILLVYVSALMFVLRHFAGSLAHKLSPTGMMFGSSLLAGLGLVALSAAHSPIVAILAATVWGAGVCYMWPTMLAIVSERFPKGGAWVLGLMGTAGNLAIYRLLPMMGGVYDKYTQQSLPSGVTLDGVLADVQGNVPGAEQILNTARADGAPYAFRYVAALSVVLIIVFGIMWVRDRAAGGYKVEKLTTAPGVPVDDAADEA